jgi:hypothetical protein
MRSTSSTVRCAERGLRRVLPRFAGVVASREGGPILRHPTSKATHLKKALMDISKVSDRMKAALVASEVLHRPPPARIPSARLQCLGRTCGLTHLSKLDDDDVLY